MKAPWEDDPIDSVAASQADARRVDNAIVEKAAFMKSLKPLKLNTRDKELYSRLFAPADEVLEIEREEATPANMKELDSELKRVPQGSSQQAILLEEKVKLQKLLDIHQPFYNVIGD